MSVAAAAPAIIDDGSARFSALAQLSDCDLKRDLQSTLGREARCFDFGDCLAASQARLRASHETVAALWVGKSCHGGVWANGNVLVGAHGGVGNWAHLQLPSPVPHELDGRPCWCGRGGCLETFLSTTGLEDDYERVTGEHRDAAEIASTAATGAGRSFGETNRMRRREPTSAGSSPRLRERQLAGSRVSRGRRH